MALPTLVKTWQYNVNQYIPAKDTTLLTNQQIMWQIKESLKGFGSTPWTVVGSGSSAAFGLDGNDRWVAPTNLVWAASGSAHSWIVLKQTGLSTNFQLCIDLNLANTNTRSCTIVISSNAGFTGGSNTARPTATDEQVIISAAAWTSVNVATGYISALHVTQTSDGAITRVIGCYQNNPVFFWNFEKVANPSAGWSMPVVSTALAGQPSYATLNDVATSSLIRHNTTNGTAFYTSEGWISAMAGEQLTIFPNDIDGLWPFMPIGIASATTGLRGRHGNLTDLYYGVSSTLVTGTTFPNDGSRIWVQFGDVIIPWNGTNPIVA